MRRTAAAWDAAGPSSANTLASARRGAVERRLDSDGRAYTRDEYVAFYGGANGAARWEANW